MGTRFLSAIPAAIIKRRLTTTDEMLCVDDKPHFSPERQGVGVSVRGERIRVLTKLNKTLVSNAKLDAYFKVFGPLPFSTSKVMPLLTN